MKFKSKYKPNVVGKGKALPLGNNYYYMKGPKHSNGGIKIGKSDKTGIEVEGGEIMHVTPKETRVFSSVPFLQGSSPVEKVLGGENPNKVFKEQEDYKDRNNLNDDGTMKNNRKKYVAGGEDVTSKKNRIKLIQAAKGIKTEDVLKSPKSLIVPVTSKYKKVPNKLEYRNPDKLSKAEYLYNKAKVYLHDHPNTIADIVGTGANIIGSLTSHKTNKKMLEGLQYAKRPASVMPAKLKTKININPQLEKMRESIATYERAVDANTASSKVAQERKMNARLNKINITNQLYAQKENQETQLINHDKLNAQHVAMQNAREYNRWAEGKAAFENNRAEQLAENEVGLTQNLIGSVQDLITRSDARRREKNDLLLAELANPNTKSLIEAHGITSGEDAKTSKINKARKRIDNYER